MNQLDILLAAMFHNLNKSLTEFNFFFTANKQSYKIKINPKDKIWQYLYRFSVNQKELKGIIYFGVSFNETKLDIATPLGDIGIKEGDTLIIDSEIPLNEYENDNIVKKYIRPFPESFPEFASKEKFIGIYEGELKNGEPEGNGRFFHIMGFYNEGEWKGGKQNGKGIEKGIQGETYVGEFKDDKRNGKGTLELADGEIYEGNWLDGKKHGKGKTIYPNGDIYEGDFANGLGNGKGIIKWTNGNEYEGDMKDDLMDGKGILKWKEGHIYEGDFLKDNRTGKGIFKMNNGIVYEGEFLNGDYNGKGVITYPEDGTYEGEWKENKKNGKGIFKFKNGDIYEGEFMNNLIDGFGKKTYTDGRIENGLWENNKFMKDYNENNYLFSLKCIKTINNPSKAINELLQLKDGRLISCSREGILNIHNKDSYEIDLSIKEHLDEINSCIELNDGRIVTCSKDCTIKIIKLMDDNKYEIEATLKSHEKSVLNAIEIKDNEIISISEDQAMKIWDLSTFQNIKTIENNCDNILKLNENEFITSSSKNNCIKFWNKDYQNALTINDLKINDFAQSMCLFEDNKLIAGGSYTLYLIDAKKHEFIKTFELDGLPLSVKKCLDGNILCTVFNGNRNNHIIKYDIKNLNKIFEKKKAHNNPIFSCIQLNNGIIVSAEGRRNADSYEINFWKILEKEK